MYYSLNMVGDLVLLVSDISVPKNLNLFKYGNSLVCRYIQNNKCSCHDKESFSINIHNLNYCHNFLFIFYVLCVALGFITYLFEYVQFCRDL